MRISIKVYFYLVVLLSAVGLALLIHALSQGLSFLPVAAAFLLLILGVLGASRLYNGMHSIIDYLQHSVVSGEPQEKLTLPWGIPGEYGDLALRIQQFTITNCDNRRAIFQLKTDLERRVDERTESLVRNNRELAILNSLIRPLSPSNEIVKVIDACVQESCEITKANVKLNLFPRPINRARQGVTDSQCEQTLMADADGVPCLFSIRSSELDFGYLSVEDAALEETDCQFLQTLAHSAGIILQNEILLRTNQERHAVLKAVMNSSYDGTTWTDNKGIVRYANHRMSRLFEVSPDKLRGATEEELLKLFAAVRMDDSLDTIDSIRSQNGAYQLKIRTPNGRERHLIVSVFPVTTDNGSVLGRGYLFRDITKLWGIDKMKSDLISLVSHEFKTPITSIKGSVETLLRQDAVWEEEFKRELLVGIHEDIGRIRELVSDWLDLSKIAAGTIGLNQEPVRVGVVVKNAVRQLPKHFSNGAIIDNKVQDDLPLINADRVRLEQVVANLLTNAIRYNDRTPRIEITATKDEQFVHIAVADNGIGVRSEDLALIFERLNQDDKGIQRRDGGTGLGLAICKGIMQAHGGDIRAESTMDVGSVFTISIPQFRHQGGGRNE